MFSFLQVSACFFNNCFFSLAYIPIYINEPALLFRVRKSLKYSKYFNISSEYFILNLIQRILKINSGILNNTPSFQIFLNNRSIFFIIKQSKFLRFIMVILRTFSLTTACENWNLLILMFL